MENLKFIGEGGYLMSMNNSLKQRKASVRSRKVLPGEKQRKAFERKRNKRRENKKELARKAASRGITVAQLKGQQQRESQEVVRTAVSYTSPPPDRYGGSRLDW